MPVDGNPPPPARAGVSTNRMHRSRGGRGFTLLALACLVLGAAASAAARVYEGAIVVEVADGAVLFEDRADYVGPPASVTKLMTFLVVHDAIRAGQLSLATPVTATAADAGMGGTQVWLRQGETFPVEELLHALMVQSANDAAHALTHAAGASDREQFVARMNARAQALGMRDTIWRTPHGLPPRSRNLDESDLTSPRDLATLALALLRETDVLRYSAVERRDFGVGVRTTPVAMDNHNNLVGRVAGVDGLKTGFTRQAGFCLVATAARDGRRLVAVIMGAPSSKERDIKMAELLENAFATPRPHLPALALPSTPQAVAPVPVFQSVPLETPPPAETDEAPLVTFEVP